MANLDRDPYLLPSKPCMVLGSLQMEPPQSAGEWNYWPGSSIKWGHQLVAKETDDEKSAGGENACLQTQLN